MVNLNIRGIPIVLWVGESVKAQESPLTGGVMLKDAAPPHTHTQSPSGGVENKK